jgi:transposase
MTIGLDLGDKTSRYCALNQQGEVAGEGSVATTRKAMTEKFGGRGRCRIAMEVGTHSPWLSRLLTGLGHEVIVANARQVRLITESTRKDDKLDARLLARLARPHLEQLRQSCCGRSGIAARKRRSTCWRFACAPRWWTRAPAW